MVSAAGWHLFVFGQPILQQLYTVFDFTAFSCSGRGGLHFALAAKPQPTAPGTFVLPIQPSSVTGMPVRFMQLGVGPSSSPVTLTIDSGSGIIDFNCLQAVAPYYQANAATLVTSCAVNEVEGGCSSNSTTGALLGVCTWEFLYFPGLSQPIGEVSQDSIQIYALPTETEIATTPTLSFKGTFGCITRANDLTTLKTSTTSTATLYDELLQYVNTCPPPVFAPANCTTDTGTPATCSYGINATCPSSLASWDGPPTTAGAEAGHHRAKSAIPSQLVAAGVIKEPVWGMCLTELVRNTIGGCNATDQPSYIIYDAATPAGAALKTTPMMTSAQVNASAAALNMSTITQDRRTSTQLGSARTKR
ncbi:hypothetical protein OEZ85_002552 [Tetradesmus obliquus]|uniref:Peptidase A1 domain-containing protein n=1 Tax=Tetradesmus obliquus TaxID=3088 RepID=A0ABY8TXV9_TETOB|nr:hypothetical protein OEZ85_002552 [Tetradesmus obliquus]